MKPSNMYIASN